VSAQQSFIIDRGEQVHTLEAAKALLAAQVAAFPAHVEEAFDEDEAIDIEVESEVETEETEGLTDDAPISTESGGEADADGRKRKRRRRRRGRPGEAREGGPARDENDVPQVAANVEADGIAEGDGETDEDESEEQPGEVRTDPAAGGERRPRRRGRRGGRRRRGGPEDGLMGSIADELGPTSVSESIAAVADFDGYAPEPHVQAPQPEPVAPQPEPQQVDQNQQETPSAPVQDETQEAERAARRRSTVREKVSFAVNAQSSEAAAMADAGAQPEPPAPAPEQPAPEAETATQPRRAGWWSRRFGNGE
jgi:ribonuclease E